MIKIYAYLKLRYTFVSWKCIEANKICNSVQLTSPTPTDLRRKKIYRWFNYYKDPSQYSQNLEVGVSLISRRIVGSSINFFRSTLYVLIIKNNFKPVLSINLKSFFNLEFGYKLKFEKLLWFFIYIEADEMKILYFVITYISDVVYSILGWE